MLFGKSKVIFVFLFLLMVSSVSAQTPLVQAFGGDARDKACSVIQTEPDGGYVIGGSTWGFGVVEQDFMLSKFDSDWQHQWTRTLGGWWYDVILSVIQTSDGGYAVAGSSWLGAGQYDALFAKYDNNGNYQWSKTLGGTDCDYAHSIVQTSDGGYAIGGYGKSYGAGGFDFLLAKFDASVNSEWTVAIGGAYDDVCFDMIMTDDGGFALTGGTFSFAGYGQELLLVKLDGIGQLQWATVIRGMGGEFGHSLIQTSDGGYAVGGTTGSYGAGQTDLLLAKFDASGNHQWTKTIGGANRDYGTSVIQADDGGFVLAGYDEGLGAGLSDFFLAKFGISGNYEWTRVLGSTSCDEIMCVIQTEPYDEFVAVGFTEIYGLGDMDAFIAVYNSKGNTCLGNYITPPFTGVTPTVYSATPVVTSITPIITDPTPDLLSPTPTTTLVCRSTSPQVTSTTPAQNELNVPGDIDISVTFDTELDDATVTDASFVVSARSTGLHRGNFSYDSMTNTVTLDPDADFEAGEVVTVILTTAIESATGASMEKSYIWSFTVASEVGGCFLDRNDYETDYGPWAVIAAELNDDGHMDLATRNGWNVSTSYTASVLINNGTPGFPTHTEYTVDDNTGGLCAADFDADGDLDLVTANCMSDNVSILLNYGDGTYAPHTVYSTGAGSRPQNVTTADIDGDGDLDVITANAGNDEVSTLMNNGDGTFASSVSYPVGDFPHSVTAGDLDGDGDLDLATSNSSANTVSALLNNGTGTFAPYHLCSRR